ncbi:HNH endonuclease [Pleionea sediminis]|uniref:HNH endonuclease n=1 Tax=Pleionea sediminis TaxID=2569479 RepID=UPI0011860112|nr:HNH endonuclease [Pleionea sediminis]
MNAQLLKLDKAGRPINWIGIQEAATLYVKDAVLWTFGNPEIVIHGGINRQTQMQSRLKFAPVIAVEGKLHKDAARVPHLTNSLLFARDHNLCMYCGEKFARSQLTRDHIYPKGLGGRDSWENCVSACRSCNNRKGCRTPEQAGMKLLAIPYKPNKFEYLALSNRNILADQMAFLEKGFSKRNRQFS